jgi:hypothetical protein
MGIILSREERCHVAWSYFTQRVVETSRVSIPEDCNI